MVIPILNSLGAGAYLRSQLPHLRVYDGCIYITGYVSAPGEISQNNTIFKIVYGLNEENNSNKCKQVQMEPALQQCGIAIHYSESITIEIFKKLTFTSAFAAVAAYYNKQAADLQAAGTCRELFLLLLSELYQIATAAKLNLSKKMIMEDNVLILNSLSADFTASFQKDIRAGRQDEREQLLFDIIQLAETYKVAAPNYLMIAKHFGYHGV